MLAVYTLSFDTYFSSDAFYTSMDIRLHIHILTIQGFSVLGISNIPGQSNDYPELEDDTPNR